MIVKTLHHNKLKRKTDDNCSFSTVTKCIDGKVTHRFDKEKKLLGIITE